ncbi:MAG TPA: heme-binding protein [Casimicrobiaceae bacterium]|nr:heme-binding protein [Casimicrobiaceae bacterium]
MRNAKTVPVIAMAIATFGAAAPGFTQKLLASYPTLTTDAALRAAQAALAQCQKQGYTVAVAVTDRGGQPLALLRDNLAGAHTSLTAINKAYTAVSFRTDTTELAATTQAGKPSSGIRQLPQVVAVGGGLMVRAKGSLVGAIAVSGAPNGDADDACAKAGVAAISDAIELE